jgi:hypothetical protein
MKASAVTLSQNRRAAAISLGNQQEFQRIANAVNRPIKVLPIAGHLEVNFVHPPTFGTGVLAPLKFGGLHRHHLDCPAMHSAAEPLRGR